MASFVTSSTEASGLARGLSSYESSLEAAIGEGTKVLLLINAAISGFVIELCLNFKYVTIGKK